MEPTGRLVGLFALRLQRVIVKADAMASPAKFSFLNSHGGQASCTWAIDGQNPALSIRRETKTYIPHLLIEGFVRRGPAGSQFL